jgi:predicted nucleic acid-binding protein
MVGSRVTTDTTVLVRGLVPPRRKRHDVIFEEYIRLHSSASEVLRRIEQGEYQNHIPLLALIETACVVSRLTNDPESASLSVSFVSSHAKLYDTADLLERSIEIGIASKASGFDVIFMACADVTGSQLITDDRKMYERARESGIDTTLLREWEAG